MSVSSQGFNLLPPDPGTISPDLALDAALAPVIDLGPPTVEPFGRGWAFDFTINQFVKSGLSPAEVHELDHLRVWVEKTLRTARYAHAIYSDSYGMEEPFGAESNVATADVVGIYQQHVTDALLVHDRIADVQDFFFQTDLSSEQLYVSFTVVLDGQDQQTVQVSGIPLAGSVSANG